MKSAQLLVILAEEVAQAPSVEFQSILTVRHASLLHCLPSGGAANKSVLATLGSKDTDEAIFRQVISGPADILWGVFGVLLKTNNRMSCS